MVTTLEDEEGRKEYNDYMAASLRLRKNDRAINREVFNRFYFLKEFQLHSKIEQKAQKFPI